ncbi:MAG: ribosomal-processing cysteine protease Prp [Clostridium sp.]|nr:MAG: ribosomal-processing cysteine protease Prp [Clostridium sp.]
MIQHFLVVSGHSGYAQNGHDIVCAAISTACIMSANLIERLDLNTNIIDLVCDEGYFSIRSKKIKFLLLIQ